MDRDAKIQKLEALREKRRRLIASRPDYTPNSGQKQVHKSQALVRFVASGNGAGKTTGAIQETRWMAYGDHPYRKVPPLPTRTVVVLDHPDKVKDKWLPELRKWVKVDEKWLKKNGRPYVNEITWPNGSITKFMFHEQPEMVFESSEADAYIFDEPPPRHAYIASRRGGRLKHRPAWYLIVGTPLAQRWIRKEIYEPWKRGKRDNFECFRWESQINESNLADGYLHSFARDLTDQEKEIRLRGRFFDLDGLALAHLFDYKTHVVDPWKWPEGWPCVLVIDPHPNKHHVAVIIGSDRDSNLFVIAEHSSSSHAAKFAKELRNGIMGGKRIVDHVCDSYGSGKTTGGDERLSFIEVLNTNGIPVRATTYDEKADEVFIEKIRNALVIPENADNFGNKIPRLRFFSSCPRSIDDVENVSWMKYKGINEFKPKLDITNCDFLACIKYGLASGICFIKGRARSYKRKKLVSSYGQRLRVKNL